MSRNRGGTCELSIGMHTAHGVCHTIGSRACCHVIRMEGTACAAAGSNREIFLTLLGLEECRQRSISLTEEAIESLSVFPQGTETLISLARQLCDRKK